MSPWRKRQNDKRHCDRNININLEQTPGYLSHSNTNLLPYKGEQGPGQHCF